MMKSLLRNFHGHQHDLINRYEIPASQITKMFHLS